MPKPRSLNAKLEALRKLRGKSNPESMKALSAALADVSCFLVAEAAGLIAGAGLKDLGPELVEAFDRFMEEPETTDKRCMAKIAIADGLNKLEFESPEVFLKGVRFVQEEPVWGGTEDTAGPLRGACVIGLVRIGQSEALPAMADLLADPEKAARIAAATALGYWIPREAAALLRLKIRLGDKEPVVLSECFTSLIKVAPDQGVPLVGEFLTNSQVQAEAALALGESRRPEALALLIDHWKTRVHSNAWDDVLLAIALVRSPAAVDFLVNLILEEPKAVAVAAVGALAIHRYDEQVTKRVEATLQTSGKSELLPVFKKKFHQK